MKDTDRYLVVANWKLERFLDAINAVERCWKLRGTVQVGRTSDGATMFCATFDRCFPDED